VAKEESYFLPKKAGPGTLPEQLTSRSEGAALMQRHREAEIPKLFSLIPRRDFSGIFNPPWPVV
jgi:hypothetical protein